MCRLKLLHPKYNCTYAHLLTYNQNIKKKKLILRLGVTVGLSYFTKLFYMERMCMGFSNGDMKSKVHKYNHTQHQLIMFHLSTKKVLKILYGPNLFSFYCKVILLLNVSRLHINSKYVRVFCAERQFS